MNGDGCVPEMLFVYFFKKNFIFDAVFLSLKRQCIEIYDIDGDNKTGRTVQTRRLGCSW